MNIISVDRVTRQLADKLVLDEVSFGVDERDRIGVIGLNGSGKTTLLRLVAGLDEPDGGRVVHADAARVHHLGQDPQLPPDASALACALAGPAGPDPLVDRADVQREQRARALLDQLGVVDVDEPVGHRSGGQRKRIALARTLLDALDDGLPGLPLLVLDEPTNHLDVDVIEWLEDTLRSYRGALLFVTHDRYLLDRVANRIVEVWRGGIHTHRGSYADYLEARELREEQAAAAERKRRSRARVELEWLRRGPKARTSKAKHRVEQAEALQVAGEDISRSDVVLDLPSRRIGGKVVNLHNVGKRFGGQQVLRGVDYKLAPDDRIGIVGPNGSGKTTLLRLITGDLEPDDGKVVIGDTVVMGVYGQEPPELPPRTRVIDAVKEVVLETNTVEGINLSASQLLERFLFGSEAQKAYVEELSGGERRRLELLRVLALAPNLLLLDEPTNDLDLDTLAVLEEYLDAWPGALVVASHDRFFLDRVCEHLFSIEPDGSLRHHPGGYSAWRERERERQSARRQAERHGEPDAGAPEAGRAPRPRKLSYNEQRELRQLDRRIPELEARKAALAEQVQAAGADYERAAELAAELDGVLADLERAELRWLELSELDEAYRSA